VRKRRPLPLLVVLGDKSSPPAFAGMGSSGQLHCIRGGEIRGGGVGAEARISPEPLNVREIVIGGLMEERIG
jgi:hypothetical protein